MDPDYGSVVFYLFALIADCALVFINVYFLALFSDLESDQINPIDMCKHLNLFILPEMVLHSVVEVLFLLHGSFVLFFVNLPLTIWNAYRIQGKKYKLDATQIYRDQPTEQKILFVKLGFYMICFCLYLFYLIRATLGD
eukprot:TRINITY_DN876_c0_g1_i1.p1 TRINITY_DN876_c0_g1~~TRINITY_DN876_c0_g1_i1.p1  ORF type:complete len:139 (-),score=12.95 TRINITY_DN876_c0_g1_i1:18-434(-)